MGKWISLAERMPRDGQRVLAFYDDGIIRMDKVQEDGKFIGTRVGTGGRWVEVTHWMELPAPPERVEP